MKNELTVNNELLKAALTIFALLVFVGLVNPVLLWAVLNVPPESLGIGLGTVYVWWGASLSVVITGSLVRMLFRDDGSGMKQ